MSERDQLPERVTVACNACDTRKTVDRERSHDVVTTHNDKRHDGDFVAGVVVQTDEGKTVLPHPDDVEKALDGDSNE